jgi:molybdopterin converting factor small subunit
VKRLSNGKAADQNLSCIKNEKNKNLKKEYNMPMPVIRIPTPLRSYVSGKSEIPVQGLTVADAMESLLSQYPAMRPHLTNSNGQLRPFVNLFIGESNVRDLQGLDTPLKEDDKLLLIPSIAGG